jgi:cytochrome c biogenesis protein CcdA/thiol-disulfide isomerase/thioredoxin
VLVLLGVGFLAGLVTALSPCVLPVLPVLLAGGASGGRRRPLAIVAGLVVSFATFTLVGATLLDRLGLPQDLLRNVAIGALLLLAATLVFPRLAYVLERPFYRLTRYRVGAESNGLLLGASLGLVFVPCAGPVLAAVTAVAATGDLGARTVAVTVAYACGAALPMLALAVGGRRLAAGVSALRVHALGLRRAAGVVIGATALAIALGADQRFTTAVPGYTEALQERIERNETAQRELRALRGIDRGPADSGAGPATAPPAPDFQGIAEWVNTPGGRPLSIPRLRGKVVLVDFWTYSCINCLRTLPHLRAWDDAYRSAGLQIVGVHTPEFAFERVPSNVRDAIERLRLPYPVALDNRFATWNAYFNEYWPAKYLIDREGRIRYTHFGEGAYDETEERIRALLGEQAPRRAAALPDRTPNVVTTPETYLGYLRLERLANERGLRDRRYEYRFPGRHLRPDELAYDGLWRVERERIVAARDARVRLRFRARDVFLVLAGTGRVDVLVDGRLARRVAVRGTPRLYTLLDGRRLRTGLLELRFTPRLAAYAFTFG